jgi:hypothetical protein
VPRVERPKSGEASPQQVPALNYSTYVFPLTRLFHLNRCNLHLERYGFRGFPILPDPCHPCLSVVRFGLSRSRATTAISAIAPTPPGSSQFIPAGPVHARISRGWAEIGVDFRIPAPFPIRVHPRRSAVSFWFSDPVRSRAIPAIPLSPLN